jgi:secreted Zn-dependent insulinase-like peptidase
LHDIFPDIASLLGSNPFPSSQIIPHRVRTLPPSTLHKVVISDHLKIDSDVAVSLNVELGVINPLMVALTSIMLPKIRDAAYVVFRIEQQLGYVVLVKEVALENVLVVQITLESGDHTSEDLLKSINDFLIR